MARILKEDEYNAKRSEILDFALHLVYTRGYAQMTIQDILDGLHISRGALYHYFDSKEALLEALVERMGKQAEQAILPIVEDPHLSALEKFRRYFELSASLKSQQKELITSLMRMWYSDENTFLRQKLNEGSLKGTSRLFEPIIRQGIQEKVFTTRYPRQAAVIITGAALSLTDTITGLLLAPRVDQAVLDELAVTLDAYVDCIERILGAPAGSLKVFGPDTFKDWMDQWRPEQAS